VWIDPSEALETMIAEDRVGFTDRFGEDFDVAKDIARFAKLLRNKLNLKSSKPTRKGLRLPS